MEGFGFNLLSEVNALKIASILVYVCGQFYKHFLVVVIASTLVGGYWFPRAVVSIALWAADQTLGSAPPTIRWLTKEVPVTPDWVYWGAPLVLAAGFGLGCLAQYFFGRVRTVTVFLEDRKPEGDEKFVAERHVPGSETFHAKMPKFCARVEVMKDGKWYHSGMAFKTKYGILTAGHVVCGAEEVRLVNDEEEKVVDRFKETELDLVVIGNNYGPTGMTQAKLAQSTLAPGSMEMVMATDGTSCSLGPLRESNDFGYCAYEGSTHGGFSGSPYYVGNRVYGLHLGSKACNFGMEIGFVGIHLEKLEDSEDWVLDKIRKKVRHTAKRSPYDPDEMQVKINGQYVIVDRQAYEQALQEERDAFSGEEMVDNFEGVYEAPGMGSRKKSRGFKHRPMQLERASLESATPDCQYDDSGNLLLPAVTVIRAAGLSQPHTGDVKHLSTRISRTTESSPRSSPSTSLERRGSTRALKSKASPSTSSATRREDKKTLRKLNQQVTRLTAQLQEQSKKLDVGKST